MDKIFVIEPYPSVSEELYYNNHVFSLMVNHEGDFNELVCKNQCISINSYVTKILILGYATWENQVSKIKVLYEEGYEEEIEFAVSDWVAGCMACEQKIWMGKFIRANDPNEIYMGKICVTCLYNKYSKMKIQSIQLPNNAKIHIFAMTICGRS